MNLKDKQKVLDWLNIIPPKGTIQHKQGLNDITKILKNVEKITKSEIYFR